MNKLFKYAPTALALAILPAKLFAIDHFYIGVNGFTNYIPEKDFKFTKWELQKHEKKLSDPSKLTKGLTTFSLNDKIIENKLEYGFGGSLVAGHTFSGNCFQLEFEAGMDISSTIKAKNTTIPTSSSDPNHLLGNIDENGNIKNNPLKPAESAFAKSEFDENNLIRGSTINDKDFLSTQVYYGMVNGYFNINVSSSFIPYIGGGVGIAHYKVDLSESNFGDNTKLYENDIEIDYENAIGYERDNATNTNKFDIIKIDIAATTTTGITEKDTGIIDLVNYGYTEKLDDVLKNTTTNNLIFNLGLGANYIINESVSIGGGYRVLSSAGEIELEQDKNDDNNKSNNKNKIKHHFMRHNIMFSAKFML